MYSHHADSYLNLQGRVMDFRSVELGYQIWSIFWYSNNMFKFRNIIFFLISTDDVSIHPSVILQILMSSQTGLGVPKDTFWYLKMISGYTINDIAAANVTTKGRNYPLLMAFFWYLISAILALLIRIYTFPTEFFGYGSKSKNELLYWYVHDTYRETS